MAKGTKIEEDPFKKDQLQERIKQLEDNEKKLKTDLITLENHKKQAEQHLLLTLGGLSELRLITSNK